MTDEVIEHLKNLPISPIIDPDGKWMFLRNGRVATTSMHQGVLRKQGVRLEKDSDRWTRVWEEIIVPRIDDVVIFTFVRNSWERVCSAFFQCRDKAKTPKHMIDRKWGFQDYVKQVLHVKGTSVNAHFASQYDTFCFRGSRIPCVFVGRFERLQQDWKTVAKRIEAPETLPHWNAGNRHKSSYTDYYDDKSKDIVGEMYAKEIDALGYKFEE